MSSSKRKDVRPIIPRPLVVSLVVLLSLGGVRVHADSQREAREKLIAEIEADVRATSREIGRARLDPSVLKAIGKVPRHEFVPERYRDRAYLNRPLPIGHGQTISQPYIVAIMTELLNVGADDVVLEVGTGSGYQAAVLAEIVDHVHSIEIVEPLAITAEKRLARLGYDNVSVTHGDGYYGLPDKAPFDAIIVTAAAGRVPPPLLRQLAVGGRMLVPVGDPFSVQHLMLIEKDSKGRISTRQILPVRFVPLTGEH